MLLRQLLKSGIYKLAVILLIFVSCKSRSDKESASDNQAIETQISKDQNPKILGSDSTPNNPKTLGIGHEGQSSLVLEGSEITAMDVSRILENYIQLKSALVNSNNEKAASGAGGIVEVLLVKNDHFSENLSAEAEKIMQSPTVEKQREYFRSLSKHMYSLIKEADLESKYYYQFCPMAFNNEGAYWISENEMIRNPYFGDAMLRCGSTKDIID